MTDYNPTAEECTGLDERDVRALTEKMTVLWTDTPDFYSVTTESGSEYTVDARHGSCTCPDAEHRDVKCKHQARVEFATCQRQIPSWVNADAVDPQLGLHVGGPVATDGGEIVVAGDDQDQDQDDECWCADRDLACYDHFEMEAH